MDSMWPEEDWLKPIGEIKVDLPKNIPASRLYQDYTPGGRNVIDALPKKLDDSLAESVAGKSFIAEFYAVACHSFSYQAATIAVKHRRRASVGGLGVAEILSHHLEELIHLWKRENLKQPIRFPIAPGTIFGEFWNVDFRPHLELGLVTIGPCTRRDTLVMFRPKN